MVVPRTPTPEPPTLCRSVTAFVAKAEPAHFDAYGGPGELHPPISDPYFFGGLIMMWAPGVPGYISHGPGPALVESPVDSGVAYGV